MTDILICQPIFGPDRVRLDRNLNSIQSLYNYFKTNKIDLKDFNFVFGGWCKTEEYWKEITTRIKELFNVNPYKFEKNYGKATVVNNIIIAARSKGINFDYILTMDSDILFDATEKNIFERLKEAVVKSESHRKLPVGMIGLNQKSHNCHMTMIYDNNFEYDGKYGKEKIVWPNGPSGIAGGCVFVSSKGWDKIKGYRLMGVYAGDDAFLLHDLFTSGMSIQVIDTLGIVHPPENDEEYAKWKVKVCQRDTASGVKANIDSNIKEADDFWSSRK